jgi:hypothetical protein
MIQHLPEERLIGIGEWVNHVVHGVDREFVTNVASLLLYQS